MMAKKWIWLILIGLLLQCNGIFENKNRNVINDLLLFLRPEAFTYSSEGNPGKTIETKEVETNFLYQLNPELVARMGLFYYRCFGSTACYRVFSCSRDYFGPKS